MDYGIAGIGFKAFSEKKSIFTFFWKLGKQE